jgi:RNA polymerase sigma factor (sigma-70 family)
MLNEREFATLMDGLNRGSQEAISILVNSYGRHVLRVVRRRLRHKLRSRFDSTDFAQEVWKSFFAIEPGKYAFQQPEELMHFLVNLAYKKVMVEFRRQVVAQKRTMNRVHSFDSATPLAGEELVARGPTPSQVAVAKEQWQLLVQEKPDYQRRILMLLNQGSTHAEIAQQLGLNEKTVRRLVQRLQKPR